jgi:hypothetical protein
MCIRLIFRRRVFSNFKSNSKFSRHGQIEENPPETLDEPYGRQFEGHTGNRSFCLLRYAVSDQTRNVWEMRESTKFEMDLGSILDAARFTVLRPVYSDTRNLGTPYKYAGVLVLRTEYWME